MKINFATVAEQLDYEISVLKKESKEPAFAQYLCTVESRLIGNPENAKALRLEMIKNYNTYAERMSVSGISVAGSFHDAVYPGMDAPEVAEFQMDPNMQSPVQPVPNPFDAVLPGTPVPNEIINGPVNDIPMQGGPVPGMPVQGMPQQSMPMPNMYSQNMSTLNVQQQRAQMSQASSQNKSAANKNRAEFAVGGIVLSVLGTILILSGAITLAVNFFDTTWQGICLYAVCVALLLFSELFIRKFVDKLSSVLSSLAMGGVFVVTLVNYFALHIYNMPVTFALLMVLSVGVGVYSYFRNSFLFTLIGYFASFLSLSLLREGSGQLEIYLIFGILLGACLLWTAFPIKQHGRAFSIIQVFTNIFLVFWYTPTISGFVLNNDGMDWFRCMNLLSASYAVLTVMVLLNSMRYYKDIDAKKKENAGSVAFYKTMLIIANAMYGLFFLISFAAMDSEMHIAALLISGCAVVIPNALVAYLLYIKDSSLWFYCIYALAFLGTTCLGTRKDMWGGLLVSFLLMAGVSAVAYFKKSVGTQIADLLMKLYLFCIMFVQIIVCNQSPEITRYICIIGMLIAIGMATGYKLPIQILMTGLLAIDIAILVPTEGIPIAITGVLALAVGLFHNIEWLKSKNMYAFDILVWITLLITILCLYIPIFRDETATVALVLVFGLAIMIQYYFKRYNTILAGKLLPLGIFVTVFVPIFRMENLVVSIILMGLALASVALGFIFRQKGIRIYGLVLAMIVCAKIGFYDFWSSEILIKTIMFFVVGVLALIIAGVYIVVEKKMSKLNKAE